MDLFACVYQALRVFTVKLLCLLLRLSRNIRRQRAHRQHRLIHINHHRQQHRFIHRKLPLEFPLPFLSRMWERSLSLPLSPESLERLVACPLQQQHLQLLSRLPRLEILLAPTPICLCRHQTTNAQQTKPLDSYHLHPPQTEIRIKILCCEFFFIYTAEITKDISVVESVSLVGLLEKNSMINAMQYGVFSFSSIE